MLLSIFNTLIGKHITFCDDYLSLIVRMHCFILSSMEMKFNITWWSCSGLEIGIKGKNYTNPWHIFFSIVSEKEEALNKSHQLWLFSNSQEKVEFKNLFQKGDLKEIHIDWTVCVWHFERCCVCTVVFNLHLPLQIIRYHCCLEDYVSEPHYLSNLPIFRRHTMIFNTDGTDAEEGPAMMPVIASFWTIARPLGSKWQHCLISKPQCLCSYFLRIKVLFVVRKKKALMIQEVY